MADNTKELIVKLSLQNQRFQQEMLDSQRKMKNLAGETDRTKRSFLSFKGIAVGLGAAIAGGAMVQGIKTLSRLGAQAEQTKVAFKTFLGSAAEAEKTIAKLNKFSAVTPFEATQVKQAGKALLAFGIENENLIDTLTMVGDTAAATGKDFNELAIIYGKAKTAGTLFSEDINQLTEAGIPIIDELSKVLGVATNQVKKMASEGKIQFPQLEEAFRNMTGEGGRFFNLMAEQSKTFGGRLSTLVGNFTMLAERIGGFTNSFLGPFVDMANNAVLSILGTENAFKKQEKQMKRNQISFNANIRLLQSENISEENRQRILADVNDELRNLGVAEVAQADNLKEIRRATRDANKAFEERIRLLAGQSLLQEKENEIMELEKWLFEVEDKIQNMIASSMANGSTEAEATRFANRFYADEIRRIDGTRERLQRLQDERDRFISRTGITSPGQSTSGPITPTQNRALPQGGGGGGPSAAQLAFEEAMRMSQGVIDGSKSEIEILEEKIQKLEDLKIQYASNADFIAKADEALGILRADLDEKRNAANVKAFEDAKKTTESIINGAKTEAEIINEKIKHLEDLKNKYANNAQFIAEADTAIDILKEELAEKERLRRERELEEFMNSEAEKNRIAESSARRRANLAINIASEGSNAIQAINSALSEAESRERDKGEKASKEKARKLFRTSKALGIATTVIDTSVAVAKALANPPGPPFSIPQAISAGVSGAVQTGIIASQPMPAFAQGGIIRDVAGGAVPNGEDGLIAVQRGEAVLNRSAVTELGEDTINALNSLGGTTNNNTFNVRDGRGALDTFNEFARTQGASRGAGL
jgi:tape measure domain-containing protein